MIEKLKMYYQIKRKNNRLTAENLARTSKRLDLCSAQIAHVLHLSGLSGKFPIRDKVCVEIGSGWVLSHSLILYLLGAKRVIATDVERIAYPPAIYKSINESTISIIRDILSPFEEHSEIRARLNKLMSIRNFNFSVLEELGIEYIAPIDLAKHPLNTKIDFVISFSVLEHVPKDDVLPLLVNLKNNLSDEGKMIHTIHLEDHKNFLDYPFDFFCTSEEMYTREMQNIRGNRIRWSQWNNIFSQVNDIEFSFLYKWIRRDKKLPSIIDPSIHDLDDEDLATSHFGIFVKKKIYNDCRERGSPNIPSMPLELSES